MPRNHRTHGAAVAILGFALAAASCTKGGGGPEKVHKMGEAVQVGALEYTVLEVDWLPQLAGDGNVRLPRNRFAQVRLHIRNKASKEVGLPLLSLEDEKKTEFRELDDIKNVADWPGILRTLKPDDTLTGRIFFDAPMKDLRLRATDISDPMNERTALIEIPVTLDVGPAVPTPGR